MSKEFEAAFYNIAGILSCIIGTLLIFRGPKVLRSCIFVSAFSAGYLATYNVLNSPFWEELAAEYVNQAVYFFIFVVIIPLLSGLIFVRLIKSSLYYGLAILRLTTFAVVGYSLFTLIIQQLTKQLWINHSMPFVSINFSDQLTEQQNIILTVMVCVGIIYSIWHFAEKRPILTFIFGSMTVGLVIVIMYQIIPELNDFLSQYSFILTYLVQQTQQVSIDVSFYVSLVGTIIGVIVGLNFSNDIIEQGLSMLCGCIVTTLGILCIYSSNYGKNNNISGINNGEIDSYNMFGILIFTFGVLALGVCRRFYVPSERRLRYIAKLHAKRVWKQLEEKQRRKYEKLLNDATSKMQYPTKFVKQPVATVKAKATTTTTTSNDHQKKVSEKINSTAVKSKKHEKKSNLIDDGDKKNTNNKKKNEKDESESNSNSSSSVKSSGSSTSSQKRKKRKNKKCTKNNNNNNNDDSDIANSASHDSSGYLAGTDEIKTHAD